MSLYAALYYGVAILAITAGAIYYHNKLFNDEGGDAQD